MIDAGVGAAWRRHRVRGASMVDADATVSESEASMTDPNTYTFGEMGMSVDEAQSGQIHEVVGAYDRDGDGRVDMIAYDRDGDGVADKIVIDTDGDGVADSITLDRDFDGRVDFAGVDHDGDGYVDVAATDTDGDGTLDTVRGSAG